MVITAVYFCRRGYKTLTFFVDVVNRFVVEITSTKQQ